MRPLVSCESFLLNGSVRLMGREALGVREGGRRDIACFPRRDVAPPHPNRVSDTKRDGGDKDDRRTSRRARLVRGLRTLRSVAVRGCVDAAIRSGMYKDPLRRVTFRSARSRCPKEQRGKREGGKRRERRERMTERRSSLVEALALVRTYHPKITRVLRNTESILEFR